MEHTTQVSNVYSLTEYRFKKQQQARDKAKHNHPTNHNPDKSNRTK